jgi:glycosyltransferase involved in cell wall biosynthesis
VIGVAIPRPNPELLANALQRLAQDNEFRLTLGRQARQWAEDDFAIEVNARLMYGIYQDVCGEPSLDDQQG